MAFKFRAIGVFFVLALTACGGHKKSTPADTSAPTVASVTTTFVSAGNVTLNATATDNVAVSAYCFATTSAQPTASDACFQASSQKAINLSTPQQRYYVWAKDAAGNVSSSAGVGPCSSDGFRASDTSQLKTVCMMTSLGEMVIGLEATKAPNTVTNFLKYVNDGFYSNTVFHRVMSNFMVQGGEQTWTASGGYAQKTTTYDPIAMELPSTTGLSHVSGTIAMARTNSLDSASASFFINVVDNLSFDSDATPYAVFGSVISTNNTLVALKTVPVVSNGASPPELSMPRDAPPVIQWVIQLK